MTLGSRRAGPFAPSALAHRRRGLLERIGDGVAVIPTAPIRFHSGDVAYPFRPDSDFLYLTGFTEPEAVAVLAPGCREGVYWLLVRPRDTARERWDGPRAGPEGAKRRHGADAARPISELEPTLERLLRGARSVYQLTGHNPAVDAVVARVLRRLHRRGRAPAARDLAPYLHEMRVRKSRAELSSMRAAAAIACEAHRAAMGFAAPGLHEYEVQAVIEYEFRRRGASGPAYPPIVASGENACVLHYTSNSRRLRQGDLLLVDAGCEYQGYNSDLTRTFPVGGRFTREQRELYDLVLAANTAAIAAVRPGVPFDAPHRAAVGVLAEGLAGLGLLRGSAGEAIESGEIRKYFMHRTSHWLGLDVHDVGAQIVDDRPRALEAGMVLTVEPGVYVGRSETGVPARFRGIGIRIEDDVLVKSGGREVLTRAAPRTPGEIEASMALSRKSARRAAPAGARRAP